MGCRHGVHGMRKETIGAHHEYSGDCPGAFAAALTAPFADDGVHGQRA